MNQIKSLIPYAGKPPAGGAPPIPADPSIPLALRQGALDRAAARAAEAKLPVPPASSKIERAEDKAKSKASPGYARLQASGKAEALRAETAAANAKALAEADAKHGPTKPADPPADVPPPAAARTRRSPYDWEAAEAKAKDGKLPAKPPITHRSYRKRADELEKLAKAGDLAGLKAFTPTFADFAKGGCSFRTPIALYRKLCITALSAKA